VRLLKVESSHWLDHHFACIMNDVQANAVAVFVIVEF